MRKTVLFAVLITTLLTSFITHNKVKYDLIKNEPTYVVVLLKQKATFKELDYIANYHYSLVQRAPHETFSALFYYRKDWKGNPWYAKKLFTWDFDKRKYVANKLEISKIFE